ncbi:MAG: hypothetical protein AB4352_03065 [Hormoscilla sp.]
MDLELFRRTYLPASLPREIIAENERSVEEKLYRYICKSPAAPI